MKKNVFFILLDGCEFSTFSNLDYVEEIAPNIYKFICNGVIKKIISNGMITQVSLPAILTQTYPLDFNGYNLGIKYRPKSVIELFSDNGYETSFLAAHDITGPRRNYERGARLVKSIYDFDDTIEDYIRLILYYDIKKFENKKISKKKMLQILQTEFSGILNYALESNDRVNYFFMPRRLKVPNKKTKSKIKKEILLLESKPEEVLHKIKEIPSMFYKDYLGVNLKDIEKKKIKKKIKIKKKFYDLKVSINKWFKSLTKLGFSLFPIYLSPVASEIIREAVNFIKQVKRSAPWFIFMQLMDVHDGSKTSRYFNFFYKLFFLPKLLIFRKKNPTHRDLWRDLSLIYLDRKIKDLVKELKRVKKYDDTIFYFFGDHGMGWDNKRDISNAKNLGLRTHYEHIEVPLIISPCELSFSEKGVHDGMSISASLIEQLRFQEDKSFQGVSIFKEGKEASIVESVGRGNCDLINRDIYFTVTSENFKIMFCLVKHNLHPVMMFNKQNDPNEYNNLLTKQIQNPMINDLACFLVNERKKFLLMRKVDIKSIMKKKYKWIVNTNCINKLYKPPQSYS